MVPLTNALKTLLTSARDAKHFGWKFVPNYFIHHLLKKNLDVSIGNFGVMNLRIGSSDISVIRNIFAKKEYDFSFFAQSNDVQKRYEDISRSGKTPLIIDAGANIGAAAVWFAVKYPKATILAIEPDPANAECCRNNCKRLPNVKVIKAAVGSQSGKASLTNNLVGGWEVRTLRAADGSIQIYTIPQLETLTEQACPFIIKIDIEGFESDLFDDQANWLKDYSVVIIELHDWLMPGQRTSRSFQRAIAQQEYEVVVRGENLICFNRGLNGSPT